MPAAQSGQAPVIADPAFLVEPWCVHERLSLT
jgi:hypothetical protein